MHAKFNSLTRPRLAFLLVIAVVITCLFFWVIRGFVVALFVSAVLAGLLHPFYRRIAGWLGGRKGLASAVTVLLSLLLLIIPMLIFLGILAGQAVELSNSAEEWLAVQKQQPELLQQQLEKYPQLKELLPYQDQIMAKATQLAAKVGSLVVNGLAATAKGTAEFFLMLFVMLVAMAYFLTEGRALLDAALRFTPLTEDDKEEMFKTILSVGRATLKGTVVIGIIQGGLGGLAFWVAGVEGALFWAAVMAVSSVIPTFGTALVWVPMVAYLALDGQIAAAVGVGLWCALIVGSADNILRPLLIGKDTEMPDIVVMLTTLGGIALFGATGILIGPIIGALYMTAWTLCGDAFTEESKAGASVLNPEKTEGA
jgi:predicted PurR-regulated permease PerM